MISTFWRIAVQLSRRLYVRVLMIALLSVLSLLVAKLMGPLIPEGLADVIGAKAVDPILQTLSSSMLAVSIFSLTIMTGAFRTAGVGWSAGAGSAEIEGSPGRGGHRRSVARRRRSGWRCAVVPIAGRRARAGSDH